MRREEELAVIEGLIKVLQWHQGELDTELERLRGTRTTRSEKTEAAVQRGGAIDTLAGAVANLSLTVTRLEALGQIRRGTEADPASKRRAS